jgi:23S rRNA (uracil1939-C5)-methyltransferase
MDAETPDTSDRSEPELARLSLQEMGPLGDTYAQFEDDTINVFGGIPGEDVVARIVRYRRRRKNHVSGLVTEVLNPSPHRVAPPCPYFGPCTGCQWQHIEYSHQLGLKREAVERQLGRFPSLEDVTVSPTMGCDERFNYRNHARFTVRREGSLGYVNRITRRFVRIDECMLMAPWINHAIEELQDRCQETTQLSIRCGVNTGDTLIQPTLRNPDIPLSSGQTHFREELSGRAFRVASPSFFQVNTAQAERLAELVLGRLQLSGTEVLIDAYAGVGTFAALVAPHVRKVIAVEESAAAVRDATVNMLGLNNVELVEKKTEDALATIAEEPGAVILDPPRAGCHPAVLEALVRRGSGKVIYVSCDPETLARDLDILVRGGFGVVAVDPVDMFPQTYHVECVTTLQWRGFAAASR